MWLGAMPSMGSRPTACSLAADTLSSASVAMPCSVRFSEPPSGLCSRRDANGYGSSRQSVALLEMLASAAADEPPSQWETPPDMGFIEAFVGSSLVQLTMFLPFVVMMALAIWRSGLWERRVIREELANEVGGAITPDEYQDVIADGILRTRRIDGVRSRQSAALVNAQHELAFRKRRVKDEGGDPERDPLVAGWRSDIRRLRPAT
jgi:hypothetical protein